MEIAILKVSPITRKILNRLVNPEINTTEEATSVHEITNEMVKNKPTFKLISRGYIELLKIVT